MSLMVDAVYFRTNGRVGIVTPLHLYMKKLNFRKVMQFAI